MVKLYKISLLKDINYQKTLDHYNDNWINYFLIAII